jgi:hypothetical protein
VHTTKSEEGPATPDGRRATDPALDRIAHALNDRTLSHAQRAELVVDYRDSQIPSLSLDVVRGVMAGDKSMPVTATGERPGMHMPLYERLADDPRMQAMMLELAGRINATDPAKLDMQTIFAETQLNALSQSYGDACPLAPNAETNLVALQAMATLVNEQKFDDEHPLPPELASRLPKGLWEQIHQAGDALTNSRSTSAAVMSRGTPAGRDPSDFYAPFSTDNNYHFFSHAFLAAELQQKHGMSPHDARGTSGFIGAQYELRPGSQMETSGNAALKDVLMNAEGAQFGTDLMRDASVSLPGMHEGPEVEDRRVPGVVGNTLPPDVQRIVQRESNVTLSSLLDNVLVGTGARHVTQQSDLVKHGARPQGTAGP